MIQEEVPSMTIRRSDLDSKSTNPSDFRGNHAQTHADYPVRQTAFVRHAQELELLGIWDVFLQSSLGHCRDGLLEVGHAVIYTFLAATAVAQ